MKAGFGGLHGYKVRAEPEHACSLTPMYPV